ncbi:MAG: YafY family protein [Thermomicrobiales bacterium]
MRRSDRLTGILIALQGRQRTAADLAERFSVTRRTILRDIDALGELGVPIVSQPGRNGGFRIAEGFWLPPMQFTRDEASVVLLALDHLADAEASPLGEAHRAALDKVRAALGPSLAAEVERGLASLAVRRHDDPVDPATLDLLRAATETATWVRMIYGAPGDRTERIVLPTGVHLSEGRWFVDAADSLREGWRRFLVSRIESIRRAGPPPNAAATLAAASLGGAYHADTNPLVEIRLTARGVSLAADHADFRHHLVGDRITFRCPASELAYYSRELIRLGVDATVVAPTALRILLREHLEALAAHHAGSWQPADSTDRAES